MSARAYCSRLETFHARGSNVNKVGVYAPTIIHLTFKTQDMYVITIIDGPNYLLGRVYKIEKNKYHLEKILSAIEFEGGKYKVTEE